MFSRNFPSHGFAALLSTVVGLGWFALIGNVGIDLADEGYYWYGTQRVLLGEVPIRDFLAYDPARYLYAAFIASIFGAADAMQVRLAAYLVLVVLIFSAIAIFIHATRELSITRGTKAAYCVFISVILSIWMYPYYKVFDQATCFVLAGSIYIFLLEASSRSYFLLGIVVGGAWIVGRNHGVYGILASAIAFIVLLIQGRLGNRVFRNSCIWVVGIVLGYSPMLVAFVLVDGFFMAFIDGARAQINSGSTNIGILVPWPWTVDLYGEGRMLAIPRYLLGGCFVVVAIAPFLLAPLLLGRAQSRRHRTALIAMICVCIPYAWYAFSRADLVHIVLPMMVLVLFTAVFVAGLNSVVGFFVMCLVTAGSIGVFSYVPSVNYLFTNAKDWRLLSVGRSAIYVDRAQLDQINRRLSLVSSTPETKFIALPDMPTIHAMLGKPMYVHDIYVLSRAAEMEEEAEIRRIDAANPAVILVSNAALDKKPGWRFSELRPRTYAWISDHYEMSISNSFLGGDRLEVFTHRH